MTADKGGEVIVCLVVLYRQLLRSKQVLQKRHPHVLLLLLLVGFGLVRSHSSLFPRSLSPPGLVGFVMRHGDSPLRLA